MKTYAFEIMMTGQGDTWEEAWKEAVEKFTLDPGSPPEEDIEILEDDGRDVVIKMLGTN